MRAWFALPIVLAVAACAEANDKYPSLALRPIESRSDAEPVTPEPAATPDAALDAQLAATDAQLATTAATFELTAAKTEMAAKAPSARTTGSDQWLAAQSGLAEIEGLQGDTLGIVTDLERMVTARGEAAQPPYPALDALNAKARTQYDAEAARVAAIRQLLGAD